ncbi:MAG: tRNA epoxyqueuosine(34) reductase QueG [Chthoniobacterales bacterium]|nr:tRNA epoxyqueuosine(34) reductase QueG [Chthoniobacterales bacterium]MCX7712338.1 tRNA epoxyqueuosine(34) reductase QueG [Chthoniobacterales bacterium]
MNSFHKETLRQLAADNGFPIFGVAVAQPAPHSSYFHHWLLAGHHADMAWLYRTRHLRTNPDKLLHNPKSIIALGIPYFQGRQTQPASFASPQCSQNYATGQIARFAWGIDYHETIPPKLRPILHKIQEWGYSARLFCDSSPLLERDYALLAGIGWQGKSTMILNRKYGKWILLSFIITDLPLPPDTPAKNYCGSCQRCLLACPTRAISEPYHLDARRCISYLTIENKGPIPIYFREAISNRIFGCDACLEVCPWNRFAQAASETAFYANQHLLELPLRFYLTLDEAKFLSIFSRSPIRRIGLLRMQRNVCIALGNVGTADDIPTLSSFASVQNDWLREHALWALEKIQSRFLNPKPQTSFILT